MEERFSVDRVEGNTVVLLSDSGAVTEVPAGAFDFSVFEGMILRKTERRYIPDDTETGRRRDASAALLQKILDKNAQNRK